MTSYPDLADAQGVCERLGLHVRDAGALASAISRPCQVVWGVEAYPTLHLKAAALLDAVNRSLPLHDGNERLSVVLTILLYALNGVAIEIDPAEGDAFIRTVGGDEHLDLEGVASWLAARTRP